MICQQKKILDISESMIYFTRNAGPFALKHLQRCFKYATGWHIDTKIRKEAEMSERVLGEERARENLRIAKQVTSEIRAALSELESDCIAIQNFFDDYKDRAENEIRVFIRKLRYEMGI